MRGAPHSGLSELICRISARSSVSIRGRPPSEHDFQRQYRRKPARCQRISVSGRMIVRTFRTDGNQQYSQIKAIVVREPNAAVLLTPQNDQLMSERCVLGFKPALRLEWREQDGQHETQQRDHDALTLSDSFG